MLRKLALVVGIIAGISSATCTDYSTFSGAVANGVKITGIQTQPDKIWIQFAGQTNNECPGQHAYFVIDGTYGSDMFRMYSSIALYAFQTGSPVTATTSGFFGSNTFATAQPRIQNLYIGASPWQ